jgi:hypothetical protein
MKIVGILIKILIAVAAIAVVIYYYVLPSHWQEPYITAVVPATARLGEEIPVTITIYSDHTNIEHHEVRFFTAGYMSSAVIPGSLVYPIILKKDKPRVSWSSKEISRTTWPTETVYRYTVPLGEPYREGKLDAGTLTGRIDVFVDYPDMSREGRKSGKGYASVNDMLSAPFEIELTQ